MITITSKQAGFRRCGIAHPAGATEYPTDRFTDQELDLLKQEPLLHIAVDTEAEGKKKEGKGK